MMNLKRKGQIGSWIFMVVAVTFAGIAAVNFVRGVDQRNGLMDAGRAAIAQTSALVGAAFGLLAIAVAVSMRDG